MNTKDDDPYSCPSCGKKPPEFNGEHYKVCGKNYPQFQNEQRGYNGWSDTHTWEEVHHCCDKEFVIYNGI